MTDSVRFAAIRQQIAAALPHIRRGAALPWTLSIAAYSLHAVFATGDLNQIIPFVTGIGGGLIGDTLLGWATSGKRPDEAEIAGLLAAAEEQGAMVQGLLADLNEKLGVLDLIYAYVCAHPEAGADLLTESELRAQFRLFGASLDDKFRQMHERFDRLEEILGETDHEAWRQRHFDLPPQPPGPPPVFVGRENELNQLHGFLGAVAAGEMSGGMIFVHGRPGVGKRELVRQWLADLAEGQPPVIARTTFLPDELSTLACVDYYRTHPVWELDWTHYGDPLRRYFPQDFSLGSYPWLALAVQLAAQSRSVQAALHDHDAALDALKAAGDEPPWRAITRLLRLAVQERRPVLVVLEHFHHADATWDTMLRAWLQEIAQARLPILLVVEYHYPRAMVLEQPQATWDDRLRWFHQRYSQPAFRSQALYLAELSRDQVALFLAPDSQEWAAALHNLTDGLPGVIEALLHHWQSAGMAAIDGDGRWHIDADAAGIYPGELYDYLVADPLEDAAAAAQEMGYESLTAEHLLEWLRYAVWEGDVFTDDALARAVGWHGDALEDFQIVLDEALCGSLDNPLGLLREIPEPVALPYGDGQVRYCARYEFNPPVIAAILRERQDLVDRRRRGHAYAQALDAAYAPHQDRVLATLIWIYDTIGLPRLAAGYRLRSVRLTVVAAIEAELPILDALARDWLTQRTLLTRVNEFFRLAYRVVHPERVIPWLWRGLDLTRRLPDRSGEASTLQGLAWVYSDLGEKGRALELFNQALPIFREVGDRSGEASTLCGIAQLQGGSDSQSAAALLEQAIATAQAVQDREVEAMAWHYWGVLRADQDDDAAALCFQTALALRQAIQHRFGEIETRLEYARFLITRGDPAPACDLLVVAAELARQHAHPLLDEIVRFQAEHCAPA